MRPVRCLAPGVPPIVAQTARAPNPPERGAAFLGPVPPSMSGAPPGPLLQSPWPQGPPIGPQTARPQTARAPSTGRSRSNPPGAPPRQRAQPPRPEAAPRGPHTASAPNLLDQSLVVSGPDPSVASARAES